MIFDLRIDNGTLVDGSGAPGRPGSIAVKDGRIVAMGDVSGKAETLAGRRRQGDRAGFRRHPHPLRRPDPVGPHADDLALARRHHRRHGQLRLRHRPDPAGASAHSSCGRSRRSKA